MIGKMIGNWWRRPFGPAGRPFAPVRCPRHGLQGIGLVCEHVASAADRGERVGFHQGDAADRARPDAWCAACEHALVALAGASSRQWFRDARFRILCAACWDEAQAVCGSSPSTDGGA